MKKTHASLLFAVMATSLIFSGCQKPVEAPAQNDTVTGSITIEPADETAQVNGSIIIEQPQEKEVNGSINILNTDEQPAVEVQMDTEIPTVEEVVTLGN